MSLENWPASAPMVFLSFYFFYPESTDSADVKLYLNSGSSFENNVKPRGDISVIKHGLKIPDNAADYEDFKKKMKYSELNFLDLLI